MSVVQQVSAITERILPEPNRCFLLICKQNSRNGYSNRQRMEGCGVDQKWQRGCKNAWGVQWPHNEDGIISAGWATAREFLVLNMPKPIPKSKRSFKKN